MEHRRSWSYPPSAMLREVLTNVASAPLPVWIVWAWWGAAAGWLLGWRWRAAPSDDLDMDGRRGFGALVAVALLLAMGLYFLGIVEAPFLFAS